MLWRNSQIGQSQQWRMKCPGETRSRACEIGGDHAVDARLAECRPTVGIEPLAIPGQLAVKVKVTEAGQIGIEDLGQAGNVRDFQVRPQPRPDRCFPGRRSILRSPVTAARFPSPALRSARCSATRRRSPAGCGHQACREPTCHRCRPGRADRWSGSRSLASRSTIWNVVTSPIVPLTSTLGAPAGPARIRIALSAINPSWSVRAAWPDTGPRSGAS